MTNILNFFGFFFFVVLSDGNKLSMNYTHRMIQGPHEGDHVDHGDIMFIKGEEEALYGEKKEKKEITIFKERRWPLPIPYEVDANLLDDIKSGVKAGINEIEAKTCVKFRKRRKDDKDYLYFVEDDGCWSYVGRKGGKQIISLLFGCHSKHAVVHEIMHALGFFHEQTRPDRDEYVNIRLKNVFDWARHNFEKLKYSEIIKIKHPYDYKSVMHYPRNAFSKNGEDTIVVPYKPRLSLGQPSSGGISPIDALQLNELYCSKTTGKPTTSKTTSTQKTLKTSTMETPKKSLTAISNARTTAKSTTPSTVESTVRSTTQLTTKSTTRSKAKSTTSAMSSNSTTVKPTTTSVVSPTSTNSRRRRAFRSRRRRSTFRRRLKSRRRTSLYRKKAKKYRRRNRSHRRRSKKRRSKKKLRRWKPRKTFNNKV